MPATARLRHALTTPVLLTGLLVSMTVATPAKAEEPEPTPYAVARPVVLKRKPPAHFLPLTGYHLTATFGAYGYWSSSHTGLDFAAPYGSTIRAISRGTVVSVEYDGSYGLKTVIETPDGTHFWFCHQAETFVAVGQTVRAGQSIGSVGLTGNTTGAHLHLEVRPGGGDPIDPYAALARMGLHA